MKTLIIMGILNQKSYSLLDYDNSIKETKIIVEDNKQVKKTISSLKKYIMLYIIFSLLAIIYGLYNGEFYTCKKINMNSKTKYFSNSSSCQKTCEKRAI
jgi:uncharacterized ion transporter superfamily protein YfcC